jgi:hypothetical protein
VTQVVPDPFSSQLQIVRDYRADLKLLDSNRQLSSVSLEGYISFRILLQALKGGADPINREEIIERLEGLESFDIGLEEPLFLSPAEHQASHRVWPARLEDQRFVPFDWQQINQLIPPRESSQ